MLMMAIFTVLIYLADTFINGLLMVFFRDYSVSLAFLHLWGESSSIYIAVFRARPASTHEKSIHEKAFTKKS